MVAGKGNVVSFSFGDVAWISFSTKIYGSLSAGNTVVAFDASHLYPNPGRLWETNERLKVTGLGLYPAVVRDLMTFGDEWATKYDLSKMSSITSGR